MFWYDMFWFDMICSDTICFELKRKVLIWYVVIQNNMSDIIWYYLNKYVLISNDWTWYVLIWYERSAKPQLKNAISGQSYRFWDFAISFYSISWLHHAHPLANCMRKAFLHLHFSVWSIFDCPALSFVALQLYGLVWYMSMQLQITVAPNKFESSCWKKSGWALTATCSMPFIHSPAWKAMERRKYA